MMFKKWIFLCLVFLTYSAWAKDMRTETFIRFLTDNYGIKQDQVPSEEIFLKYLGQYPEREDLVVFAVENAFFAEHLRFDAARALVYLAKDTRSLDKAVEVIARRSFRKTDMTEWLFLCQKLAIRGGNAVPCGQRILEEEVFEFELMGTKKKISKPVAFTFLMLNMPERFWVRWVQDALWAGGYSNMESQRALAYAVFYAVSLRGDAILEKISSDETRSPVLRDYIDNLILQIYSMEKWAKEDKSKEKSVQIYKELKLDPSVSEMKLRALRQEAARHWSISNVEQVEKVTFLIRSRSMQYWEGLQRRGKL